MEKETIRAQCVPCTSQLQTSVLEYLLECHSSDLYLQQTLNCEKLVDVLGELHLAVLCNFSKLYNTM